MKSCAFWSFFRVDCFKMKATVVVLVLCSLFASTLAMAEGGDTDPSPVGDFETYVLELTWTPDFCCSRGVKQPCNLAPDAHGMKHLTLSGLYPAYETIRGRDKWPSYCADYFDCANVGFLPSFCYADRGLVAQNWPVWKELAPLYAFDGLFDHDWRRHGSCSGLIESKYWSEGIRLTEELAVDLLHHLNEDGSMSAQALRDLFGGPVRAAIKCNGSGQFKSLVTCWEKKHDFTVGEQIDCPFWMKYQDSCDFNRVFLTRPGACPAPDLLTPSDAPNCRGFPEEFCSDLGFVRCARAGKCTNTPFDN